MSSLAAMVPLAGLLPAPMPSAGGGREQLRLVHEPLARPCERGSGRRLTPSGGDGGAARRSRYSAHWRNRRIRGFWGFLFFFSFYR